MNTKSESAADLSTEVGVQIPAPNLTTPRAPQRTVQES